jgi:hypothetical protein
MSFELAQTPTLEAVATGDEQQLAEQIQARVTEAVADAEAWPEVARALESAADAARHLNLLRAAERALHARAKDARLQLERDQQAALEALVQAAAHGTEPEWSPAARAAETELQVRLTSQAIERLTEHQIPLAHIASLREEAHALEARARALETMAQQRAEKLLGQIREAVSGEMVLPVDLSKGVSGALLARAKQWRTRAVQLSTEADGLERSYQSRL